MCQEDLEMAEPNIVKRKTIYKVHPNTVRRLKREALVKRLSDGKKAAQEARNNPQPLALLQNKGEW